MPPIPADEPEASYAASDANESDDRVAASLRAYILQRGDRRPRCLRKQDAIVLELLLRNRAIVERHLRRILALGQQIRSDLAIHKTDRMPRLP